MAALKTYKVPDLFTALISEKLPENIIAKKNGFSYIQGYTVVDILNQLTNYNWDWIVHNHWVEMPYGIKADEQGKYPKGSGPVAHVQGEIILHFIDENGVDRPIRKGGFGAQAIVGNQSVQENIYKGASTDCIKKCASYLGIAAELYRKQESQRFFEDMILMAEQESINENDPWTEEEIVKHKKEFEYIKSLLHDDIFNKDELNEIAKAWSNDKYNDIEAILPNDIEDYVKFLCNMIEEVDEESE